MTEYHIKTLEDLLDLDDEQLMRLLPDLVLWHRRSRQYLQNMAEAFKKIGQPMPKHEAAVIWVDDGKPSFLGFEINIDGKVISSTPASASNPEQEG